MTTKQIQENIKRYSTKDLFLYQLAIYRELAERDELPEEQEDPALLEHLRQLSDDIETGKAETISLDDWRTKYRLGSA